MYNKKRIPNAVIKRLPRYYRCLTDMKSRGVARISSETLAEKVGATATQIRQDLNCFGNFGRTGYGYRVDELLMQLEEIIGIDRSYHAIVVGFGYLAHALINNFHYTQSGFTLDAVFDMPAKVIPGGTYAGIPVLSMDMLEIYIETHPVDAAMLMVPRAEAQKMVDRLAPLGVRGFWNFSNLELETDVPDTWIENVHFTDSLLSLGYRLTSIANAQEAENENFGIDGQPS